MQAQDKQEGEQEDSSLLVRTTALVAELLATMSHELRTPLATIKAYIAHGMRNEISSSREGQKTHLDLASEQKSRKIPIDCRTGTIQEKWLGQLALR